MGYLEAYGAGEERQARSIRRLFFILGGIVLAALVSTVAYYGLRDMSHKQRVNSFLDALRRQDYKAAYAYWGCTEAVPCRDYPFDKFMEDWGPKGSNAFAATGSIGDSERCGTGFIAQVQASKQHVGLWVERGTGVIGFSPYDECPEPKLRIMKWIRMKMGTQK